jgi:hypothetical protein
MDAKRWNKIDVIWHGKSTNRCYHCSILGWNAKPASPVWVDFVAQHPHDSQKTAIDPYDSNQVAGVKELL